MRKVGVMRHRRCRITPTPTHTHLHSSTLAVRGLNKYLQYQLKDIAEMNHSFKKRLFIYFSPKRVHIYAKRSIFTYQINLCMPH